MKYCIAILLLLSIGAFCQEYETIEVGEQSIFEEFLEHKQTLERVKTYNMNTLKEATIKCSKGEKKDFFKFLSVKVVTVGKKG